MGNSEIQVSILLDLLGRIAERVPGFWRRMGDIETRIVSTRLRNNIESPIYISGLARSGTTIMLEMLASHPDTACHKYRDFPFLHIPIFWNWFYDRSNKREDESIERAHKDGIMVTPESPEAMEEILWMTFFPECHDPEKSNVLKAASEYVRFQRYYHDHICKLILLRGGRRYLAKGNYNISRLEYIHKLFPDARFIILVRDPKTHIASLIKQHELFCSEESRDKRILDHMRRMGHFEFGLNRRPINFGDEEAIKDIESMWASGDDIRGWSRYWAMTYGYIAALLTNNPKLREASLIVYYEGLCAEPYDTLKNVYSHCGLAIGDPVLSDLAGRIAYPEYYSVAFNDDELGIISGETEEALRAMLGLMRQP